jgi:hypothetical protein
MWLKVAENLLEGNYLTWASCAFLQKFFDPVVKLSASLRAFSITMRQFIFTRR